ncbi:hypothetical protein DM860_010323 [Cuscuta australis]|uniref:Bifunctional inhibitor/plant lipid transfer protein/seed storage helical domain-containing protein n=1 Tax=Cuscuta australis TaxID=267555 RepID=A0A328DB07_9ASTE|nr:hypothetical protein DM860_010323 [Cuscuta australis]
MTNMIHIIFLLPLFSQHLPAAQSQTGIVECWPYLLGLGSCGPFVQGRVPLPALQCCINLRQIYGSRQSRCLCPLLNGSTLSSFPINSTLALQVPSLCSIHIKPSLCSGI